jgi:hypothetical protein
MVDDPGDHLVDPAAQVTGGQPERHRDHGADDHRDQHGEQRGRPALQQPAEHVAPEQVGAQPVRTRRRLPGGGEVLHQRVVRRGERADDAGQDDHQQHRAGDPAAPGAQHPAQQRAPGGGRCRGGGGGRDDGAHAARTLGSSSP